MIFGAEASRKIFTAHKGNFDEIAMTIFRYQACHNPVYRHFLDLLKIEPDSINAPDHIPFLPVEIFRTNKVISGNAIADTYFESSGTTDALKSRHYISDIGLYEESIRKCFSLFYGDIKQYCILALLPSYLERKNASLVHMCKVLMDDSGNRNNGFYLYDMQALHDVLKANEIYGQKTILIGVSFALLDFAAAFALPLRHTTIIETGGMKGKREEITREELHRSLQASFETSSIHSEYGMTELLSQAYAQRDNKFQTPPWMKILIRDTEDPFTVLPYNKTGCINVIDLANVNSCSFLATQDLGKLFPDGSFEVLGRYDTSDIRGCNLMVQ